MRFEKSVVHCPNNIRHSSAPSIAGILGSPLVKDSVEYLRVPLIHKGFLRELTLNIIDKLKDRLSSWEGKCLSIAGKMTLVKSVTNSIPIYTINRVRLPSTICSEIDKSLEISIGLLILNKGQIIWLIGTQHVLKGDGVVCKLIKLVG